MNTKPYIAVAGGVNIDVGARCARKLRMKDSNPGYVRTSFGGVGRNIAHNLSLLGVNGMNEMVENPFEVENYWRSYDKYLEFKKA